MPSRLPTFHRLWQSLKRDLKSLPQSPILGLQPNLQALNRHFPTCIAILLWRLPRGDLGVPSVQFALWLLWDFSGLRLIYRRIRPYPNADSQRNPSSFLLWLIGILSALFGIYTAIFGFASQRYENRLDRIEHRASIIISQVGSNIKALERIPAAQKMTLPSVEPEFTKPSTILFSFTRPPSPRQDTVDELKSLVASNSEQLTGLNLSDIDLSRPKTFESVRQARAVVLGTTFSRKEHMAGANLSESVLRNAKLSNANLLRADLSKANLEQADLSRALLFKANLNRANLKWANLGWADLSHADLRWANLGWADFHGADLSPADLNWADLSHADLRWADMSNAGLREADLSGASLSGADVSGADLHWAKNLKQDQLNSARGNEETEIPPNLVRPSHWVASPDQ